jgi:hypothetical protein
LSALSSPTRTFSNFQIGLAALPLFEKEEILNSLRSYQTMLMDKYKELNKKSAAIGPNLPWQTAAMFDLDLTQLQSELDWLEEFIATVERRS